MYHRQIPNYLPHAILTTILCCLPLGLIGLFFSFRVNWCLAKEDIEGAHAASRRAKLWCTISFIVGALILFIYVLGKVFTIMGEK
jgi:hypothetical protein